MATSQINLIFSFLLIFNSLFFLLPLPSSAFYLCYTNAIYQLGDSLADTGNLIRESKSPDASLCGHLPYGISLFRHPTGRCSNGLLIIDYIALFLRLPLLNPYLEKNSDFTYGVNFAVAGATALNSSFLAKNNISSPLTNSSLSVQLHWLKSHFKSTCHREDNFIEYCEEKLRRSIFFVGEIGINEYNYAFLLNRSPLQKIQKIILPQVVQSIKRTVMEVIKLGATQVVVPGILPIGCFPNYLTVFQTNDTAAYDKLNCLKGFNKLAMFHNHQLQQALQQLRNKYPGVHIVYADYYNAFEWVYQRAPFLGFDIDSLQKACCGSGGGKYNYDLKSSCGAPEATVCAIPDTHISWDGNHLTQKAYMHMANWLLLDIIPKLNCLF